MLEMYFKSNRNAVNACEKIPSLLVAVLKVIEARIIVSETKLELLDEFDVDPYISI